MNHTSGPWTVRETANSIFIRSDSELVTICEMMKSDIGDDPEALAAARSDAKLLAAGPDLLAVVERLLAEPHGCPFCDSGELRKRVDGREQFHDEQCAWRMASDALAKLEVAK